MLRRRDSRALVCHMGQDVGVVCRAEAAWTLCCWGARRKPGARLQDALAVAQELSHPLRLASARCVVAYVSQCRRDVRSWTSRLRLPWRSRPCRALHSGRPRFGRYTARKEISGRLGP